MAPRCVSTCPISSSWWTMVHGDDDLLHLIVEIKGYRREDAKEKKSTMDTLLGARREPPCRPRSVGLSPSLRRSIRSRPISREKVESEFNKMIETVAAPAMAQEQS